MTLIQVPCKSLMLTWNRARAMCMQVLRGPDPSHCKCLWVKVKVFMLMEVTDHISLISGPGTGDRLASRRTMWVLGGRIGMWAMWATVGPWGHSWYVGMCEDEATDLSHHRNLSAALSTLPSLNLSSYSPLSTEHALLPKALRNHWQLCQSCHRCLLSMRSASSCAGRWASSRFRDSNAIAHICVNFAKFHMLEQGRCPH